MLVPRLIPCLDVKDGRVVKGVRFQELRDAGDPVTQASLYQDQGADEIVILDVSATPEGKGHGVETTWNVRQVLSIPLTVGGGVRDVNDAGALLDAGADKVAVNTAAVERPSLLGEIAGRFGSQCTVLAVDAAQTGSGWEVVVNGGRTRTGIEVTSWVRVATTLGAGEILLTSWDRDGTRSGYDLDLVAAVASNGERSGHCVWWRRQFEPSRRRSGFGSLGGAHRFHSSRRRDHGRHSQKRASHDRPGGETVIIPSIDLVRGRAVQLIGGEAEAIDAGDPVPILEKFSLAGEVAVIDIDAARGEGSNEDVIRDLCRLAPIRVGGGVRDADTALDWLDAGAAKVILGTAASPEVLSKLPPERVIAALDSRDGRVVTHGWRHTTEDDLLTRIEDLRGLCAGFLITFIEREGQLEGTDLSRAAAVVRLAGDTRVTIAGGITSPAEVRALDAIGADAQVGMALYSGAMTLAAAVAAPLKADRPDGLWSTVVVDENGVALGLAWSNADSLSQALETRTGVYQSRTRGLWVKGENSGATQRLIRVDLDCDRDALRFTVRQDKGFCHLGSRSCWGDDHGVGRLDRRIGDIISRGTTGNTFRLSKDPDLLASKLSEEAAELAAATSRGRGDR